MAGVPLCFWSPRRLPSPCRGARPPPARCPPLAPRWSGRLRNLRHPASAAHLASRPSRSARPAPRRPARRVCGGGGCRFGDGRGRALPCGASSV